MYLAEALKAEFLKSGLVDSDRFDSQIIDAEIETVYSEKDNGLHVSTLNYTAHFYCERMPSNFDSRLVVLLVSLFLANNDSNRDELDDPEIQIDDTGKGTVSITLTVEFSEDVFVNEDVNGLIVIDGENYSLGEREILPASSFKMLAEAING